MAISPAEASRLSAEEEHEILGLEATIDDLLRAGFAEKSFTIDYFDLGIGTERALTPRVLLGLRKKFHGAGWVVDHVVVAPADSKDSSATSPVSGGMNSGRLIFTVRS